MARRISRSFHYLSLLGLVLNLAFTTPGKNEQEPTGSHGRDSSPSNLASLESLPSSAQPSISSALGRDIAGYHAKPVADGFDAYNSHEKLATHFSTDGVETVSGAARWKMSFVGYGYGDSLRAANKIAPQASANRIEYRRGSLTEWYVNGPVGLEQGFTITQPPDRGNGQPLTVELSLSGNVIGAVDENRKGLSLTSADGNQELRYSQLTVRDATSKELSAWLELRGDLLQLKVADDGARYPIVIDPWIQEAKLTASDGETDDFFGSATFIAGNTVVVGAPNATIGSNAAQGAAYIFVKPTAGWATTSNFTAKLTASNGLPGDNFGGAVSITSTTAVIGACSQAGPCSNGPGKAYVYVKPSAGWTTTSTFAAELTASDGLAADAFGDSVTIAGTTVLVGAPNATVEGHANQGAVYVFVKSSHGWANMTETAKLTASDGLAGDTLGFVSLNGNASIALLGANSATVGGKANRGAAYVFTRPTAGWTTTSAFAAKLTASDGASGDFFGFCNFGGGCISSSGKTIIVGAPQGGSSSATGPGKAYIFLEPTAGWKTTSGFTAKLTAAGGLKGDNFGFSAAISGTGTTAVVGAEFANSRQGAAYVFQMPAKGWATTSAFSAKLTASDGEPFTFFSFGGAAISGTTIAVGAAGATIGGNSDQGAAYIFGDPVAAISADEAEIEEGVQK